MNFPFDMQELSFTELAQKFLWITQDCIKL